MKTHTVFTSESVTRGHPDKLCDTISDAVVGSVLRQDPLARAAVESAVSTGIVFVSAKLHTEAVVDIPRVVREVVANAGYSGADFNPRDCTVMTSVSEAAGSPRLEAMEHDMSDEDLGRIVASTPITVFGFACDQSPSRLPLPIDLAHRLARHLARARVEGAPWLSPDGTAQVSVEFEDGRPRRVYGVTLVTSSRDPDGPAPEEQRDWLRSQVVGAALADAPLLPDPGTRIDINPPGAPGGGGPARHAGLTGRKTQVDTYGEYARNSASALSGKDPGRIDRVGAYAARHAARCVVEAGLARQAEVVVTYAPGLAEPVSLQVNTWGSGRIPDREITHRVRGELDFRPGAIVRRLRLRELALEHTDGFYRGLAAYGQMGRTDLDAPWERTQEAQALT